MYESAESLCRSLNDPRLLCLALMGQWRYSLVTEKLTATLGIAQRVYSLAQEQNDDRSLPPFGRHVLQFGRFRDRATIRHTRCSDLDLPFLLALKVYSQSFLVSSVRGSGSLPTTAASAASGCTGLLRAFLGASAFFGVGIGQLERAGLGCQAKNQPCFSGSAGRESASANLSDSPGNCSSAELISVWGQGRRGAISWLR